MKISNFVFLLFTLQLIYWYVGYRASKKVKSREDYFLAGKNVSFLPLMMTFLATQVGGGIILGTADEAYLFGWSIIFYPLGSALGLILIGLFVGRKLAAFDVSTVAEIFEVVYRSSFLRKIASFLSITSLFIILVAQIMASHKFLVSLGVTNMPLFVLFWAVVIVYTVQGGLNAVIQTDMVQAAFFSLVFFLVFGFVLYSDPLAASVDLPQVSDFSNLSSKLSGWLLMPLLFMVIEQDMGQRCFAGASPSIVSRASLTAGFLTLAICVIPLFFGLYARKLGLEISAYESVLMTVINKTTTPWLAALVGCAVIAAIISTATSLINAISSNLSSDFKFSFLKKITPILLIRSITAFIGIMAIFSAFFFDRILNLLILSYGLSVTALFVPLFFALWKKKGNFLSALLSIVFGSIGFLLFPFYLTTFPNEIASLLLSLFGYGLGELIHFFGWKNRKMNRFKCLEK